MARGISTQRRSGRTLALRRVIDKGTPYPEMIWVRVWRDGTMNVGARTKLAMLDALAALERAGYRCELNGRPGTSGEYVIDVKEVK